ncbi:MAG TPA: complex I NDUFA9 subunit family protein [Sneathiellales bacterium]|nr:complex I NDUFA9 subunit family protein [Sneathiellales bacterium]
MAMNVVTVFGGSGFVGRHVVKRLAQTGVRVRVAVRRPEKALFLRPMGDVGQVELVQANIRDDASVAAAVEGADAVINLVGILYESGHQKFAETHAKGAARVATASAVARVQRFVHISAIGADEKSRSVYARTKADGEAQVRAAFPNATVIRPSLLFGPDDDFFNRFASIARLIWVMPLVGTGKTRFQPAHVGDVAAAIVAAVQDPENIARTFELGGPNVYTYRQLMELVLNACARKRILVPVPPQILKIWAWFLQMLPSPLLTVDQVNMLLGDNLVAHDVAGFSDLGITPVSAEVILPTYLWRFRPAGQFTAPGTHSGHQGEA